MEDRIANILVKVFDNYDIEPGELNKNINDTIELVREFAPVVKQVEGVVEDMEGDVESIREDINRMDDNMDELEDALTEFNKTSGSLAESMTEVANTLDRFNDLIEEAAKEEE